MQNIIYKLRLLRIENVITKAEVAMMLGISVRAYSKLERGTTEMNLSQLCKFCDFYNLKRSEFLNCENSDLTRGSDEMASLTKKLKEAEEALHMLKRKIIVFEQGI